MSKTVYDVQLIDLMPESIRHDKEIIAICAAIQPEVDELAQLAGLADLYGNIDNLPESVLQALAWENGVFGVEWAIAKTIDKKRELVKMSWLLNRLKGTPWAIKRVCQILGMRAEIVEWFQEAGIPGTFRISLLDVSNVGLTDETLDQLTTLIYAYKPLSAHIAGTNMFVHPESITGRVAVGGHTKLKYIQ